MEEKKILPRWATEAISKGAPEKEVKDGKVLSNGILYKTAIGRTDNEFIVVEKPIIGAARHARFQIGGAGGSADGPVIECPSCRSNVRLAQSTLPRSIYCINCGSRLSIGDNLSVAIMDVSPPKPLPPPMFAFEHRGYTLYTRLVELKGGREQRIYFFSKRKPRSGMPCAKPEGYEVGVNNRTGLPYLKKGGIAAPAAQHVYEPRIKSAATEYMDDLTLIHGIGRIYEKRLNAAGIRTFEDVLKYEPMKLSEIASPSKSFGNRAARQRWKAQAGRFVSEKKYAKK